MKIVLSIIVYFLTGCFLPAVGYRDLNNGALYNQGTNAWYWTSTQASNTTAGDWQFDSGHSFLNPTNNKAHGFSVRCVK